MTKMVGVSFRRVSRFIGEAREKKVLNEAIWQSTDAITNATILLSDIDMNLNLFVASAS